MPHDRNPFLGPMVYLIDEVGDMERALTLREWNEQRERHLEARADSLQFVVLQRCPRCGEHRLLTSFRVCSACTAACGWDPPCVACREEDTGAIEASVEHIATCDPGKRNRSQPRPASP